MSRTFRACGGFLRRIENSSAILRGSGLKGTQV
ncbi:hypothetical protein CYB_1128 [Synechococcus sp. JA-2-3B'a(2-13)]|nr:hypothetical protein CYB_1128 [Synechococcus sp. JA-2-3B'a(2-13)]